MRTDGTKLILIMPPQPGLLNGFAACLISLANYIQARIPEVATSILDLSGHSFDQAKKAIANSLIGGHRQRLFVGITATTASYQSALSMARTAKTTTPRATVILGGHHGSADPETVLRYHSNIIDVIVIGEGERTLCHLLQRHPLLEDVPGLAFLDKTGACKCTGSPAPLTEDELDAIPIIYGPQGLIGTPGKFDHATYVSARGCPLRCAFCSVGEDRIRTKSIPVVVRDIETLLDRGFARVAIEDNFFAHSAARTREICRALAGVKQRHKGAFSWDCQTRVEALARHDTIPLMAAAGCEAVYIGVESIHPGQLAYLNKTKDPVKYLEELTGAVIPAILDSGIGCYLNLQFGLPGETVDHERRTLAVLASLGRQALARGKSITIFPQLHVVYPGTAHFRQGVAQGRFPPDVFEAFTEWEFRQTPVLFWLGEHFAHGTGGIPEGILITDALRQGSYVVNTEAVYRISGALHAINRIPGIHTFNYGDYLVTGAGFHNGPKARNGI